MAARHFVDYTCAFHSPAKDDLARELPGSSRSSPRGARVVPHPRGLPARAVAVEPLVTDPVSVCYDADGRLYVVEMRGYPYPGEDAHGQRHAGSRTATATAGSTRGRSSSTGSRGRPGSSPTTAASSSPSAPDILYAKDTNGDGVADVKKVMFTGFGTENVQGLLNGLLWGPDGWIYGVGERQRRRDQEPDAARRRSRSRSAAATSGSSPTARRSRRSPAAASSATPSTTGATGSPATTATTSARSSCPSRVLERNPALVAAGGARRHRRRRGRRRRCSGSARPSPGASSAPASARPTR